MRKYRFFFKSFEKEEKWINNIVKMGYRLVGVNSKIGRYDFAVHDDSPRLISIDYRTFDDDKEFINYITLFEDAGWKHVIGSKESGIHYFEQGSNDCSDSVFSDTTSKAGIYKRLSDNYTAVIVSYIPFFAALTIIHGRVSIDNILHWKEYYYTPNLWEMDGWRFIFSFLWETPFAFARSCGGVLLYIIFIILLLLYFKSRILYRRELGGKVKITQI